MNAALEDVRILDELLEQHGFVNATQLPAADAVDGVVAETLRAYSSSRKRNGDAIADMALYNYLEMRDLSADADFQFRHRVEHELGRRFDAFLSRYELVSFTNTPYADVVEAGKRQAALVDQLLEGVHRDWDKIDWKKAEALFGDGASTSNQKKNV